MTRNWTDYPLTGAIPRKKIHITELYNGLIERVKGCGKSWTPLPVFYYDKPNSKLWGDDYPKADPEHWPPNQSPDNKFRNDHITNVRRYVGAFCTDTDYDAAESGPVPLSPPDSLGFTGCFIKPSDDYYRPYDAVNHGGFAPLTDALGHADFTDKTLTAGSTYIKAYHVEQIRTVLEHFRVIWVNAQIIYYRLKEALSDVKSTPDLAWSAAKTKLAAASWGSWVASNKLNHIRGAILRIATNAYQAEIKIYEQKMYFKLGLEISGMGWNIMPPISAKVCMAGYILSDSVSYDGGATTYGAAPVDDVISSYIKCKNLGTSVQLSREKINVSYVGNTVQGYGQVKGYLFDGDVMEYCNEDGLWCEFTARDDFSSAELDEHKPDTTFTENGEAHSRDSTGIKNGSYEGGCYPGPVGPYRDCYNAAGFAYVVIEPDWKYGTE